ncbi:MAG TPA: PadR family transcriptional regulator [Vicinamibacterales bacterium]|jgi:DNA-binding PadR family transcriptional regulator
MPRKPKGGPATDPELLILASLADGPKHGYAIMIDVDVFAGVTLGPGTLYTAITRLVDKKLIAPAAGVGRQRPYRLTAKGAALLSDQLTEMRRVAAIGLTRLRPA